MGSCVSLHRDPESAMKLRLSIGSKNEKLLIPSPVKDKLVTVNCGDRTVADLALKSQLSPARFLHQGSKDEAFFDSQPWLESDCEDDFYSVNGDFTPSRGSTPVHHKFSLGNQQANKSPPVEATTEPSPSDKKKRLSELFKESLHDDDYVGEETRTDNKNRPRADLVSQQVKSTDGTSYCSVANSGASSERTPNGVVFGVVDEESAKTAQCCLPRCF